MSLKSVTAILIALLPLPLLCGQEPSAMQKGNDALASRLWELASYHFEQLLATGNLDPAQKPTVAIRLCEALIRDGRAPEALEILGQSFVSGHPEAAFWTGQALAASGRFSEAVAALKPLLDTPANPYRRETGLTVASLELAMGHPDSAIKTLGLLIDEQNPTLTAKARIQQSLILLDLGRTEEAAETLPQAADLPPQDQALATFLKAQLRLQEGQFNEAATLFQQLIDAPSHLPMSRYHAAVIGMADAQTGMGDAEAASDLLLNFVQDHPDSPQLEEIFKRLQLALPAAPASNNPVLERLGQWITPPEIPATGPLVTSDGNAISSWPTDTTTNDLQAFALFTRAAGLHRIHTAEARKESRRLLTRLRLEYPRHFLTDRSLLLMAGWAMDADDYQQAIHLLTSLQLTATSPLLKGQAAFLSAEALDKLGDKDQAAQMFTQAADLLNGIEADAALFNAALIQLTESPADAPPITTTNEIHNNHLAADLQLERALAMTDPVGKRSAIEEFLLQHPDHPRTAEARLAAAEAALESAPPDLSFARAQMETIEADPEKIAHLPAVMIALTKLRIDDLGGNLETTISAARTLLADFPSSPQADEASFILGRCLFSTGNYNDARLIFEKIAASAGESEHAQAAWLLAARSAALVPTSQSQQEALTLYDKAISIDAPLSPLARIEKGRLMIDMNRLGEAATFLGTWFDQLPTDHPLYLPAGLLLGESIYAQGNINPDSLNQALAIYDKLLTLVDAHSSTYDRLQYLRGMALEQLPDPATPGRKRTKQAFVAYYSVLERNSPPEEWHYFELSGFRALSLLEKAHRWPAAIACAKKIASFNGPRASEAAARANQIQLKYMIWED